MTLIELIGKEKFESKCDQSNTEEMVKNLREYKRKTFSLRFQSQTSKNILDYFIAKLDGKDPAEPTLEDFAEKAIIKDDLYMVKLRFS